MQQRSNLKRLKPQYQALHLITLALGLGLPVWPWQVLTIRLGNALGFTDGVPVKANPNGILWLMGMLMIMIGFTAVGAYLALKLFTAIYAISHHQTWKEASETVKHGTYPESWFKPTDGTRGMMI